MLIVNFKNYVYGSKLLDIVRQVDIYCNKSIVCVPTSDIPQIAKSLNIPIYAQHVDFNEMGRSTGFNVPEVLQGAGASGSLLNHSEHSIPFSAIKKTIERCRELNFKLIICSSSLKEVEKLIKLKPFAIAFEDPALIATGKSIAAHKSDEVKKFVALLHGKNIIPICGAGISTGDDVQIAFQLGCKGVLVSSAIANSQTPEKFLKDVSKIL